jgi:hypothetical protein
MQPDGRQPLAEEPSLGEPQVLVVSGERITAARVRAQAEEQRRRLMARVSRVAAVVVALSVAAIVYGVLR